MANQNSKLPGAASALSMPSTVLHPIGTVFPSRIFFCEVIFERLCQFER
jgi:hypothetical protein